MFDDDGRLLAYARRPIAIWREADEIVEQSSEDIWRAATAAVREAVDASALSVEAFAGVGFDATTPLVVVDRAGRPLSVSPTDSPERNVIVWMDRRAAIDAERINATGRDARRYVGGRISPEMQVPKLAWLSREKPATFAAAGHFFDLSDYLSWRATGAASRSLCAAACKFAYLAHERRWAADFFDAVGLGALQADGFARVGSEIAAPVTALGSGLTRDAAAAMGLRPGPAGRRGPGRRARRGAGARLRRRSLLREYGIGAGSRRGADRRRELERGKVNLRGVMSDSSTALLVTPQIDDLGLKRIVNRSGLSIGLLAERRDLLSRTRRRRPPDRRQPGVRVADRRRDGAASASHRRRGRPRSWRAPAPRRQCRIGAADDRFVWEGEQQRRPLPGRPLARPGCERLAVAARAS